MRITLAPFFFLGKHEIRWYCHAAMNVFRCFLLMLSGLVVVTLLGACQSMTPAERIGQNPVMFRMLSPEQQLLVQQGRICEGMTKEAVFLAWGNPNSAPVTGQQNGRTYEKWVYHVYQPVFVDTVGADIVCGHHGPVYCSGVGTSTAMVPSEVAWVMFQNNVVTAWESRK